MNGFLYIYKIENLVNGKVYIGQTKDPVKRWQSHLKVSAGGPLKYPTQYYAIHAAIKKYGSINFSFKEIDIEIDSDVISNLEVYWIAEYQSNNPKLGYNLTEGGECLMGDQNPFYGKHHTKEAKELFSVQRRAEGRGRGEKNPKAKLNEEQVLEIKRSKEATKILTERFNVSRTIIQRIRSGKIWKHI